MTPKLYIRNDRGEYLDQSPLAVVRRFFEHEIDIWKSHRNFIGWARFFGLRG